MECPVCRLLNPPTAQRCDCGYDFKNKTLEKPYLNRIPKKDMAHSSDAKMKKRNPILSFLLSIITPGLGQIYNGEVKKGILFYVIAIILPLMLSLTGLQYHFKGFICYLLFIMGFHLIIIGDAIWISIKRKKIYLKKFNNKYIYILIILLANFTASWIILTFNISVISFSKVPSNSMKPTLNMGDGIAMDIKYYKQNKAKRGEVIVFKYPKDPSRVFIKRIIGLPGDSLEIRNKKVYINDRLIKEPYAYFEGKYSLKKVRYRDDYGPRHIPAGQYFVMGDNRNCSLDSRFWGLLHKRFIIGKGLFIFFSYNFDKLGAEI